MKKLFIFIFIIFLFTGTAVGETSYQVTEELITLTVHHISGSGNVFNEDWAILKGQKN